MVDAAEALFSRLPHRGSHLNAGTIACRSLDFDFSSHATFDRTFYFVRDP